MSRRFEAHIVPKGLLMRPIHWFRLLLLCVCLSMVRCEADEGVLLFHVKNLGADVSALQVDALFDGKRAQSRAEYTSHLGEVTVRIPRARLRAGSLSILLWGLASDRCKVSSARYDLTIASAGAIFFVETDLPLVPLQEKRCTLTLEKVGSGTITSTPSGIDCGTVCEADFPVGPGKTVRLEWPLPMDFMGSVTDWGIACAGASANTQTPCDVPLTGPLHLKPKRSWATCPQGNPGWCWDNPLPQGNILARIWGKDANNAWAVGYNGTILKWNGSSWSSQSSGTTQDLYGVWGSDANNVWAVGYNGTIIKAI
jgi:hypothetical protein